METLRIKSRAKINVTLDVLEKRSIDGYHYIRTIMLPISLADTVELRIAENVTVSCMPPIAGPSESNLAFRAAAKLKAVTGYSGGVRIQITKVIPVAGGLAGGSTNAAAVLRGLNQLWRTKLTDADLSALAMELGSDVPFFIGDRPALVEGIGERVTPISVHHPMWAVLAVPAVEKSTGNVFRLFDELKQVDRPDTGAMLSALAAGDIEAVARALGNVFEQVMLPRHPEIRLLKEAMMGAGAAASLMSGAGPTVFGIVDSQAAAQRVAERMTAYACRTHLVQVAGSPDTLA